jgi:hypothetical protein
VARLLSIKWDSRYLRLVESEVAGGRTTTSRAWVWRESVVPNPAQAEEAGRRLRELLQEHGVAPAPVRYVVGREAVICREIHYPDVPANEVPAIVSFQAAKELTIPPEEAVIDFVSNPFPGAAGEKRALAVIVHRELLEAIRKTCQAAGLKLEAVVPSSIGHAALAAAVEPLPGESAAVAVLACGEGVGELSVVHKGSLLFTRSLLRGQQRILDAVPELRRSFAAFGTLYPQASLQRLVVLGELAEADRQELQRAVGMEVVPLRFLPAEVAQGLPTSLHCALAGAVGLASLKKPLPINFLDPKRTLPPPSRKPIYYAAALAVAVVFLLGLIGYWRELARRQTRLQELQQTKQSLQKQIEALSDAEKRLEAVTTWASGDVVLLDELYDLIARFPDTSNLRITKVTWSYLPPPAPAAATGPASRLPAAVRPAMPPPPATPRPVARMVIQASGDAGPLERLKAALSSVGHWKLDLWEKDTPAPGSVQATVKIFAIAPREYDQVLTPPRNRTIGMPPPALATDGGDEP